MGIISRDFLKNKIDLGMSLTSREKNESTIQAAGGFIKLIVGLGNEGRGYEDTRHNIGFKVIDHLKSVLKMDDFKIEKKFKALVSELFVNGKKIILLKPTTMMNNSGAAVQLICNYYNIPTEDVLVIYDELDVKFGSIVFKQKGEGKSSHNGVRSLVTHLNSSQFKRLKVGVDSERGHLSGSDFVLARFNAEELSNLDRIIEQAVESIKVNFL